jgi:hypothetical protein
MKMEERMNRRNNLIRRRIRLIVDGKNLSPVPVSLSIRTIWINNTIVTLKVSIKKYKICNKLVMRGISILNRPKMLSNNGRKKNGLRKEKFDPLDFY